MLLGLVSNKKVVYITDPQVAKVFRNFKFRARDLPLSARISVCFYVNKVSIVPAKLIQMTFGHSVQSLGSYLSEDIGLRVRTLSDFEMIS
jgi:hypothetical protein